MTTNEIAPQPLNQFRNNAKMIPQAELGWRALSQEGLIGIKVAFGGSNDRLITNTGHTFANFCTCSYLGLNGHPKLLQGAIAALQEAGTISLSLAELRIRLSILDRMEQELADLFGGPVLPGVTCSALTAGILPLVASGHLSEPTTGRTSDVRPRVMVFDKFAHFSMAYMKPVCADETQVLTIPHNDLDALEAICRKYPRVAFVCDGAYSTGGAADVVGLKLLQDRYGLFIFADDSHSLSVLGQRGEGYVRARLDMNPLTLIVASLGKAFGTAGGIAMLGAKEHLDFLYRYAGPVGWSQNMEVPAIGSSLASIALHRTPELGELQAKLRDNIRLFDQQIETEQKGTELPLKMIHVGEQSDALHLAKELYRRGYYTSAVFFPMVPRGKAGIRIMLRADMERATLQGFIDNLREIMNDLAARRATTATGALVS